MEDMKSQNIFCLQIDFGMSALTMRNDIFKDCQRGL